MQQVELSQGRYALVDDCDYELVMQHSWYANKMGYRWYAKSGPLLMHRLILDAPDGIDVDHANGNGLDNRRCNIRLATRSQNLFNRGKMANNKSGYKGVSWDRDAGKWRAQAKLHGKVYNLGRYQTPEDAAAAYEQFAKAHHGEYLYRSA